MSRFIQLPVLFTTLALCSAVVPSAIAQDTKPDAKRAAALALQDAFVKVAEEVEPAVVTVIARKTIKPAAGATKPDGLDDGLGGLGGLPFGGPRRPFRTEGSGSGVIISSDGWIVTNDHVVGGADSVIIRMQDGREFPGVVKRDYRSDLAMVKIEASGLPIAKLAETDSVKIGYWAIAIGSPFRYEGSFSVGVISSLGRKQDIGSRSRAGGRLYPNMIQTDAAINPGNSGGPLLNLDGEVIGINTAIETESGGNVGIGFAIPASTVRFVAYQLRANGKVRWGYMGIEPETVSPRMAAFYKTGSGALVRQEPFKDSPAGKAGIQVEDVIVAIDKKPIRTEIDLRATVGQILPGTTVTADFIRAGKPMSAKVTIAEAPGMLPPPETVVAASGRLGIEVAELTVADREKLEGPAKSNGVLVKTIDTTTNAGESELRTGDVILQINDIALKTIADYQKATKTLKTADLLRVRYSGKRNGETVTRVVFISAD
jgi:serine protease Do